MRAFRHLILILIAALSWPGNAALAESFSYRYLQLDYGWIDAETDESTTDNEARRLSLGGVVPIDDTFYVVAKIANTTAGEGGTAKVLESGYVCPTNVDSSARHLRISAGARWSLRTDTDVGMELGLMDAELECGDRSQDDTGLAVGFRLHHQLEPGVELQFGLDRHELFDEATDSQSLAIFSSAASGWGLGLGYQRNEDARAISLMLRLER